MDEISCDLRMRTRVLALKVCNGDAAKGPVEQGKRGMGGGHIRVRLRFFILVGHEIKYRKVASSRPVYYSILEHFGQRSQFISIKFPKTVYCSRLYGIYIEMLPPNILSS